MADALGNLARFVPLPGPRHDSIGVAPLIAGVAFQALRADKAFDMDWIGSEVDKHGAMVVIPPKADRVVKIECDFDIYRWRGLVENFLCSLKEFRRIAPATTKQIADFRPPSISPERF